LPGSDPHQIGSAQVGILMKNQLKAAFREPACISSMGQASSPGSFNIKTTSGSPTSVQF